MYIVTPHTAQQTRLSLDRIVEDALQILDEEGTEALTMRRLAARLGVSTMSTYHHVSNRAELIEAIASHVLKRMVTPDPATPWDDAVRLMANSFRDLTEQHPALFRLILTNERPSALVDIANEVVRRLVAAGFETRTAERTLRVMVRFLLGSISAESQSAMPKSERDATFQFGLDVILSGVRQLEPV
jgi:AcrR family transcriptional regulator